MSNRLVHARSPYLRKAARQPVDWHEWGDEAFTRAKSEDKPILLSIGGVWCHWCHVMAHESFENDAVARIINNNFIPIKVDRDERPDIDRRYQDIVHRLSGTGGWPLTVFMTPDGKAFFGGTYFPPEDKWGRPGLTTVIQKLLEIYKQDRWRIDNIAEDLYQNALSSSHATTKAEMSGELIEKNVSVILASVDLLNGGFGSAPKFHHASAIEFLINYAYFVQNEVAQRTNEVSLDKMAMGGVYDHLLGGFFRYSTDDKWMVPHFEKMLYDNAELLKLYSLAYRVSGKELYSHIAEGIVDYYVRYGLDSRGGFAASQDADIGLLDEGGYYTFSLEEASSFLTEEELSVISLYFNIMPNGEMHSDPSKNVLFIDKDPETIAGELRIPLSKVISLIASSREKMLAHRERTRETPYIDKTVYTNWNGLMIESLSVAANVLKKKEYLTMAEKAAQLILTQYYREGMLMHNEIIDGFSEDYIFFSKGLIELFQHTQNEDYLNTAKNLIDNAIELFWDKDNWGFFDSAKKGEGYLSFNVKNIQDAPVQSVNGTAPYVLLMLSALTGETTYADYAEQTLQAFAELLNEYPLASHSYFVSLLAFSKGIYKVETSEFFEEALNDFRPYKFVMKKNVQGVIICEKDTCRVYESYPMASASK